jgi:glycoside transferase family 4
MRIAFLSSLDPYNIQSWSGTLYQMLAVLQHSHQVCWVGGDFFAKKRNVHSIRYPKRVFIPEMYIDYWAELLNDFFQHHIFDIIIARDYFFIAQLETDIPIVYIGDTTLDLMKSYLQLSPQFIALADEIEQLAIQQATLVVYSSEWAARNAIEHYKVPLEKIKVIEFGANFTTDYSSVPQWKECCHLLFVAKDWKEKGGEIVLETCKYLKTKGFHYKLTVIGCSIDVKDPDVEVIGYLDKSNSKDLLLLIKKYKEANIFLMPTRFDCFGIVYAEAASFGIPSFGTDVGGVRQVIKEGINGYLLPIEAKGEEYAQQIIKLYTDKRRYKSLCILTQEDAKKRLNWKVWNNKMTQLFREIK